MSHYPVWHHFPRCRSLLMPEIISSLVLFLLFELLFLRQLLNIIQRGLILLPRLEVRPLEEEILQELLVLVQLLILAKNFTRQLRRLLLFLVILFLVATGFTLRLLMEQLVVIVVAVAENLLLRLKECLKPLLLLLVVRNHVVLAAPVVLRPELGALLEQVAGVHVLQVQRLLLLGLPLLGFLPLAGLVLRRGRVHRGVLVQDAGVAAADAADHLEQAAVDAA
uniref:Uncharacterized protein n=1 Tax=Arundo donax TaxID=35708 RepID=A0A0A9E918_ARUDO